MLGFYPRDAMLAWVFATATCLSVRLSRAGIVSKWKLASWFLHYLVAPRFWFSGAKFHPQILRGPPWA